LSAVILGENRGDVAMAFDDVDDLQDVVVEITEEDHIAFDGKAAEVRPQLRTRPAQGVRQAGQLCTVRLDACRETSGGFGVAGCVGDAVEDFS
jgi:hypothetical protein